MRKPSVFILALALVTSFFPSLNQGMSFSEEYVGVWFDPFVSIQDKARQDCYSLPELVTLVSKISSKFRNILLRAVDLDKHSEPGNDISEIPLAVAIFNKEHRPPSQPPLQLVMQFRSNGWKGGKGEGSFELAKRLADEANSIFPNTVKTLLVALDLKKKSSTSTANNSTLDQISNLRERLDGLGFGAHVSLDDCGKPTLKLVSSLDRVFPATKSILFYKEANIRTFPKGMATGIQTLTKSLEICKERIKAISPTTTVGFHLKWTYQYHPEQTSSTHIANTVAFWRGLSEWAGSTATSLFLHEAFDNPYKEVGGTMGWWALVQNDSYRNATDYVFESKEELAKRETQANSNGTTATGIVIQSDRDAGSDSGSSLLIAAASLLVLMVGGVSAAAFYFRIHSTARGNNNAVGGKLTKEDLEGFLNGEEASSNKTPSSGRAYNHNMEIPKKSFEIDKEEVLGSGEFGTVYRGRLFIRNGECKVAVKTTKPSCPATALKGLLTEIKLLSYLGKQENIVGIIGAHTRELSKGRVFVLTEYCALGSLDKFLRKIKAERLPAMSAVQPRIPTPGYTSLVSHEQVDNRNPPLSSEIEGVALDLEKWSREIVLGMEYLASKDVVHADLATRNILLTEQKTAKISDFGLSRKLYNYSDYVKSGKEPLPWSWMSPESLARLVFNEKTDVWSFGITLWEIFSLGDVPYAGMSWSAGWLTRLEEGLRLERPKYDVNGRYAIMTSCWEWEPDARPTFSELKELLTPPTCDSARM